jgi:hypothetical protein
MFQHGDVVVLNCVSSRKEPCYTTFKVCDIAGHGDVGLQVLENTSKSPLRTGDSWYLYPTNNAGTQALRQGEEQWLAPMPGAERYLRTSKVVDVAIMRGEGDAAQAVRPYSGEMFQT